MEPPSRFVADIPGRTADATSGDELFMIVILMAVIIEFRFLFLLGCVVVCVCRAHCLLACAAFRRGHYGILPWRLPFFKKFWRRSRQTDRASTRSHTQQKLCAPRRFLCVFATVCVISRATLWAHRLRSTLWAYRLRSTAVIHSGATTAASDVVAVSSPKIGAWACREAM